MILLKGTSGGSVPYFRIPSVGVSDGAPGVPSIGVEVSCAPVAVDCASVAGTSVDVASVDVRFGSGEEVAVDSGVDEAEAGVIDGLNMTGVSDGEIVLEGARVGALEDPITVAVGEIGVGTAGRQAPTTKRTTSAGMTFFIATPRVYEADTVSKNWVTVSRNMRSGSAPTWRWTIFPFATNSMVGIP